jgi:hypothetical protein
MSTTGLTRDAYHTFPLKHRQNNENYVTDMHERQNPRVRGDVAEKLQRMETHGGLKKRELSTQNLLPHLSTSTLN